MLTAQPQLLTCDIPDNGQPGGGVRMAYAQWGDVAAPPLICLHGLTRNGRDFDALASRLSGRWRVICPDMPGRGASPWLTDTHGYGYPAYAADMAAFLGILGIQRTHWLGTSMGGIIGMMLAASAPGVLRSLILNDIGCLVPATGLRRIRAYAGTSASFPTLEMAQQALRERCLPFGLETEQQWQQLFVHSFIAYPDGTYGFACDPAITAQLPAIDQMQDVNLWGLWPAVEKLPVLLIRGRQSDILTEDVALQMKNKHPALELYEIPGAGHAPALMDQKQIEWIGSWLETADKAYSGTAQL